MHNICTDPEPTLLTANLFPEPYDLDNTINDGHDRNINRELDNITDIPDESPRSTSHRTSASVGEKISTSLTEFAKPIRITFTHGTWFTHSQATSPTTDHTITNTDTHFRNNHVSTTIDNHYVNPLNDHQPITPATLDEYPIVDHYRPDHHYRVINRDDDITEVDHQQSISEKSITSHFPRSYQHAILKTTDSDSILDDTSSVDEEVRGGRNEIGETKEVGEIRSVLGIQVHSPQVTRADHKHPTSTNASTNSESQTTGGNDSGDLPLTQQYKVLHQTIPTVSTATNLLKLIIREGPNLHSLSSALRDTSVGPQLPDFSKFNRVFPNSDTFFNLDEYATISCSFNLYSATTYSYPGQQHIPISPTTPVIITTYRSTPTYFTMLSPPISIESKTLATPVLAPEISPITTTHTTANVTTKTGSESGTDSDDPSLATKATTNLDDSVQFNHRESNSRHSLFQRLPPRTIYYYSPNLRSSVPHNQCQQPY